MLQRVVGIWFEYIVLKGFIPTALVYIYKSICGVQGLAADII